MDSTFTLIGIRKEILESSESPPIIEGIVDNLEKAVSDRSPLAFDLAKSLVESVCKTILNDRGVTGNRKWDLPKLFRETIINMQIIPSGTVTYRHTHEGLIRTVRGMQQTIQGLCEIRNLEGIASHGPDGYSEPLDLHQIELAARASEAIACFLYTSHKRYPAGPDISRLYYEDYQDFNDFMDEVHEIVQIFDLTFLPSQILFSVDKDQTTYRELLIEYLSLQEDIKDQ